MVEGWWLVHVPDANRRRKASLHQNRCVLVPVWLAGDTATGPLPKVQIHATHRKGVCVYGRMHLADVCFSTLHRSGKITSRNQAKSWVRMENARRYNLPRFFCLRGALTNDCVCKPPGCNWHRSACRVRYNTLVQGRLERAFTCSLLLASSILLDSG